MEPTHTAQLISSPESPRGSTLLALVQALMDEGGSETETVAEAAQLVNEGSVILTGNFRGAHLDLN